MPDFDFDAALDPEFAAQQERFRQDQAKRAHQARVHRVLTYITRRDSWDAWVWPNDVPTYLEHYIDRNCLKLELNEILDLIKRVYELDCEYDSDDVEAVCDHFGFDMDDVERAFRNGLERYRDAEEYARQYADGMGDIPSWLERYIDYESLGQDLLQDVSYAEVTRGIIVFQD